MGRKTTLEFDEGAAFAGLLDPGDDSYLAVRADAVYWTVIYRLDPDDYIHETTGLVGLFNDGKLTRDLGRFLVKQIDVDAAAIEGESIFDIFDQSGSLIDYYNLYGNNGWDFKDSVLKVLRCDTEFVPSSLLIIDRLELLPECRGRGIGLQAIKLLISRFRIGAGLVAIKPFPLQFECDARDDPNKLRARGLDQYTASESACNRKLRQHYRKLGFVAIPGTEFMCLPLIRRLGW